LSHISTGTLFIILIVLILLSGFFSGSETALMTLNRYRMKSLARKGHAGARLARYLLARPDRLLGLILLGNNFVNILASAIASLIAMRYYGEAGIAIATGLLTFVILVFAEVTPKTLAALKPDTFAYTAAFVYTPLQKLFYPLVWFVNLISNKMLAVFGIHPTSSSGDSLNADELRMVVHEARQFIPGKHTDMLLGILDLENISVEDIMIPRNDITGIDLNDDWNDVVQQITNSHRTRVPVYEDSIDNTIGMLHMRKVLGLVVKDELTRESLESYIRKPYFIPEGTSLTHQLLNFQKNRRRVGLVVDEYGSIDGLVTLEDILEEIVGQFTTDSSLGNAGIHPQDDGSYLIDGSTHIREINRALDYELPTSGPRTLNGLLLEHLEMIPAPGTSLLIANYPVEITRIDNNAVQTARLLPPLATETEAETESRSEAS
jgi:Mg2+/Co2+ transporter CorB